MPDHPGKKAVVFPSLPGPDPEKLGTVIKDATYGKAAGVDLKMDLYFPRKADRTVPAAIYVHGGGWTQGDKSGGAGVQEIPELVNRGYLVASVNYRLAPQFKFPAQIEDVKCAVRYLRAKAADYGIDPWKIGVWGGSAGGHLVALLGTSDASAGLEGKGGYADQSSRVQAVVDMFGPSDLNLLFRGYRGPLVSQLFGTSEPDAQLLRMASPIAHISLDDPPFLILHGDRDKVVPPVQSQLLYEALVTATVPATLVMVKNAGHGFIPDTGALAPGRAEITRTVADFFDRYLK